MSHSGIFAKALLIARTTTCTQTAPMRKTTFSMAEVRRGSKTSQNHTMVESKACIIGQAMGGKQSRSLINITQESSRE